MHLRHFGGMSYRTLDACARKCVQVARKVKKIIVQPYKLAQLKGFVNNLYIDFSKK